MMVALFDWLAMAAMCLGLLAVVLLLIFVIVCLVVAGTKTIKKEVEKDDRTE